MIARIVQSVLKRGLGGTIDLCMHKTLKAVSGIRPVERRNRAAAYRRELEFDRRYGIDTAGIRHPGRRQVHGSWRYGYAYTAIDVDACVRFLDGLGIRYEEFTFLDLGSGKGRALLLASAFPFHRIVGVEHCEDLHRVAEQNLQRYPLPARRCRHIDVYCADAARFALPAGPLVLFLHNPFSAPIMKQVVENVTASLARQPRRVVVVYFCSEHADLWDAVPFLHRVRAGTWPAIYDTEPPAADRDSPGPRDAGEPS